MLSNLHPTPFIMDNIRLSCMESLVQSMNFPENDWRHVACFELSGPECKAMMYEAMEILSLKGTVHWKGEEMMWGGKDHLSILRRGLNLKFSQHELSREALEDTIGMRLVYDAPENDRICSYPPDEFVIALQEIRESMIVKGR